MISHIRGAFNRDFSSDQYQKLISSIADKYDHAPPFRIAETPVFIPQDLLVKLQTACSQITDTIVAPDFKAKSQNAILPENEVPGEDEHTVFLQMDFGICKDKDGSLIPQLIEVQGFPSLYFFQDAVAQAYLKYFDIPDNFTYLFDGLSREEYYGMLRKILIGTSDPKNVVLLEIEPEQQVTYIDFRIAEKELGIKVLCISDLQVSGSELYYLDEMGKKIRVERIFNRVIFDELMKRTDLKRSFRFTEPVDVEWVGHPNWFFRVSKHTLPLLKSPFVPESRFLNEISEIPSDLSNYVLKPLYSFAGSGVIINLNPYDIDGIKDPENFILQRKVEYAPVIETPSGPSKCEVRMLMLWEKGSPRPKIVNNLARLSKGQMVGVRYNKGKDWVGGSVGFFENT